MFGINFKRVRNGGLLRRARIGTPIAADFGRRSLRLLQLSVTEAADGYRCDAAAELPGWMLAQSESPNGDSQQAKQIQEVISGLGFAGSRISVTIPAECFRTDVARLPAMPDDELRESLGFEAADRFGMDREKSLLGFLRLGSPDPGQSDVLFIALPREVAKCATSLINSSNTAAVHVEHAALAALRGVSRQRLAECPDPADARDFAMIHLEDRVASLVMVRDGAICFFRSILGDWASNGMTAQRTRATGTMVKRAAKNSEPIIISDAEGGNTAWRWCALAEEALRCLRHVERSSGGWWPREIVLTGPAACDPQAAATVESVCGATTALAVPIRMVRDPYPCVHGNSWIAGIGAACAELKAVRDPVRMARAADAKAHEQSPDAPVSVTMARRDPPTVVTRATMATQPKTGLIALETLSGVPGTPQSPAPAAPRNTVAPASVTKEGVR